MTSDGSTSAQSLVAPKWGPRSGLPLVPCPKCGEDVIELVCGQGSKVPGAIFFKCRRHEREDPTTCPWYLFADKYVKMLIEKGKIERNSPLVKKLIEMGVICSGVLTAISPQEPLPPVDEMRLAMRHLEGVVEANRNQLVPLLDDLVSLNNGAVRVDEKLQKLIDMGKIATICLVVVVVFVVGGVIILLLK